MKYWMMCFILFCSISIFAQKTDLPKSVVKTFDKKFPGIENVKWNVEKGDYKIKFDNNGKKTIVEIDGDGTWKKTSTHILFEELPQAVQTTVNELKKDSEISEIKMIIDDENDLYYRIDLIGDKITTKLRIDDKGKLIKSETESLIIN